MTLNTIAAIPDQIRAMSQGVFGHWPLTITVWLNDGPLNGVAFLATVPSLNDLPPFFGVEDGRYVRWFGEDGGQMHSVSGGVSYIWQPA